MTKATEKFKPSQVKRKQTKQQKKQEFDYSENIRLLEQAKEIYQEYVTITRQDA